jgi:hypothetical protein
MSVSLFCDGGGDMDTIFCDIGNIDAILRDSGGDIAVILLTLYCPPFSTHTWI